MKVLDKIKSLFKKEPKKYSKAEFKQMKKEVNNIDTLLWEWDQYGTVRKKECHVWELYDEIAKIILEER